jgi:hypothetical protein
VGTSEEEVLQQLYVFRAQELAQIAIDKLERENSKKREEVPNKEDDGAQKRVKVKEGKRKSKKKGQGQKRKEGVIELSGEHNKKGVGNMVSIEVGLLEYEGLDTI